MWDKGRHIQKVMIPSGGDKTRKRPEGKGGKVSEGNEKNSKMQRAGRRRKTPGREGDTLRRMDETGNVRWKEKHVDVA